MIQGILHTAITQLKTTFSLLFMMVALVAQISLIVTTYVAFDEVEIVELMEQSEGEQNEGENESESEEELKDDEINEWFFNAQVFQSTNSQTGRLTPDQIAFIPHQYQEVFTPPPELS